MRLSKYAAYNTYHHCEQCHQYMGFHPHYQVGRWPPGTRAAPHHASHLGSTWGQERDEDLRMTVFTSSACFTRFLIMIQSGQRVLDIVRETEVYKRM